MSPTAALALAIGAAIAVLLFLGGVYESGRHHFAGLGVGPFDLDRERNVPAAFSSLLLAGAAAAAEVSGRATRQAAARSRRRAIAVFFAFMALDELAGLHEALESLAGVDWQLLYVPVVVVGALGWLGVLGTLSGAGRGLWLAGPALWAAAQALEAVQWDGRVLVHPWTIVPEEGLEMLGSACFLLALCLAIERASALAALVDGGEHHRADDQGERADDRDR